MFEPNRFQDRTQAGQLLAQQLRHYANDKSTVVLALPRGGVPIGYEIAQALQLPLDILSVCKLGMPGHEGFVIGAIASGGLSVLQETVIAACGIADETINALVAQQIQELERRERLYRQGRPALGLRGRTVILVDDGLATGSSMAVAVKTVRAARPARLIVAVPVGAPDSAAKLRPSVDQLICLIQPERFYGVGLWYQYFGKTSDREVIQLLGHAQQYGDARQFAEEALLN